MFGISILKLCIFNGSHLYRKMSTIYGVTRLLHDLQGDHWKKPPMMIFKMVKIHQGDCVDDISKEISNGGD